MDLTLLNDALEHYRTVLRPVHDSPAQRVARILIPLACVAVVAWI